MKEFVDGFIGGAVAAVIVFAVYNLALYLHSGSNWKDKAVKAGKAEYYLDSNNSRQWRWK